MICQFGHECTPNYCRECAMCEMCGEQISAIEYEWCINQTVKQNNRDNTSELPRFFHPSCITKEDREKLSNATVTIPRQLFDKLNAALLLFEPNLDLSRLTNEKQSEIFASQWFRDYDYTQLCLAVAKIESVASAVMMMTKRSHKEIDLDLQKRDNENFAEAQKARTQHKVKAPKTEKIYRPENPIDRVSVLLKGSAEDKMIAKLMRVGLTEAEATQNVKDSMARAKGRQA